MPPAGVNVPPFALPDLLEDLYRPFARDGAGTIEVGVRLRKALAALQHIDERAGADCAAVATDALSRVVAAFNSPADAERLTTIHARYWPAATGAPGEA